MSLTSGLGLAAGPASPAAAATLSPGPYTVNILNREDARQFFQQVHEGTNGVADGWTGNVGTCTPGTVSADFLDAALARTNYFRTMAGVPDVTFSDANNAIAQTAALMQAANNTINHQLSTGNCITAQGQDGSLRSNFGRGYPGVNSVDGLGGMYDSGALGHRRNLLDPSISVMGYGRVPQVGAVQDVEAQLVLTTPSTPRPPVRDGFVAWPPAGFVPYQVVYPRWSFSLPGANFAGASVTMTHNGAAVPVQVRCVDPNVSQDPNCGQFAEPAISWTPNNVADGANWPKPAADDPWTVTISGVTVNGAAAGPFTYTVTIIDPSVSDAAHTISQAPSGPANPAANSSPTYTTAGVPDASGYQWRTTPLSAGDLVDGGENGLGNFTASVAPAYTPISTAEHASGANSLRLVAYGGADAPAPQTLTFNQTFLATPTSSLSYDRLFWSLLNEVASVDVSLDGGTTWQPATPSSSQTPDRSLQETAFTHQSVDLSAYAGRTINLRFALTRVANTGWAVGSPADEPNGWYIDNVSLSNVRAAGTPTVSGVSASRSFVFASNAQGPATVEVRPQFSNPTYGSAFGTWSPALNVNSLGSTGLVTLASSKNPATTGAAVTYTATVTPASATGTVSFTDNGTTIAGCESVSLTGGTATCSKTYDNGVTTPIVATYSGDGSFAGSPSAPFTQVVNGPAVTGGDVTASASDVNTGQPVTFTATVSPSDGSGTVDFYSDALFNNPIPGCQAVPLTAAGQAICTWTPTQAGNYEIRPRFTGTATLAPANLGSTLLRVTQQTTTSITSSANPATDGQGIVYTAQVSPATSQGSLLFTDNGSAIPGCGLIPLGGTGTGTCSTTISGGGTHQIQAAYSGFAMAAPFSASASTVLSQVVGTLTGSTTSVASSGNPSLTGQGVTFTATVTGGGTGTVSFTDAGQPIPDCQNVAVTGGQATCAQTYPFASSHLVAAFYTGDNAVAGSTAPGVTQVVNSPVPAAPAATVTNLGNQAGQVGITAPAARAAATAGGPAAARLLALSAALTTVPAAVPASTVTGFNVYQGSAPGAESATPINPSRILATGNGYSVKGLTAGRRYYFVVRAINGQGVGPASAEVSMVASSVPSAPGSVSASGGAGTVTVSWTAPATNGGSAITGYKVFVGTASKQESLKPVNPSLLAASTRSYTVRGLTNGQRYYLLVQAVTARASSPVSTEVSALSRTVPNAPVGVLTYRGAASMGVQWVAPDVTGGAPITGYNVYRGTAKGKESTTPVNSSPLPAPARTYTLTGLTNGTTYYVVVRAINAAGRGAASAEGSATPTASPTTAGWPGSPTAKAGAGSIALTWAAPTSTGGRPITGYNVYLGTAPGKEAATPVNASPLAATARSYTATGLTNGQAYYVTIKAINSVGAGAPSAEVTATPQSASTVPAAPATLTAANGSGRVTLTWTRPRWNGGSAVTGYNVYRGTTPGGESSTPVNASPLSASATSYTVTGLTGGTVYYFTVRARNAVGLGAPREVGARPN